MSASTRDTRAIALAFTPRTKCGQLNAVIVTHTDWPKTIERRMVLLQKTSSLSIEFNVEKLCLEWVR